MCIFDNVYNNTIIISIEVVDVLNYLSNLYADASKYLSLVKINRLFLFSST